MFTYLNNKLYNIKYTGHTVVYIKHKYLKLKNNYLGTSR